MYSLLQGLVLTTLGLLIASCVAIPIPPIKETAVFGQAVAEDEVRSMAIICEDLLDVKARLGEPIVNLGPQRLYVYMWTVRKGKLIWMLGGAGGGTGGLEPLVASHLLFIAFDEDGKVLKTGTTQYNPSDSITKQAREWLSYNGLAAQVVGPRIGESTNCGTTLFIYRSVSAPCPFPTFDSNILKPSVAVDDIVVGDLQKREYLASWLSEGVHVITIDPLPYYRYKGEEEGSFYQDVNKSRIPVTVEIRVDPNLPTYIETYLCTGTGEIKMYAVIRDAPSAIQAMRDYKPAW